MNLPLNPLILHVQEPDMRLTIPAFNILPTPPACRREWPAHNSSVAHSLYLFYENVL